MSILHWIFVVAFGWIYLSIFLVCVLPMSRMVYQWGANEDLIDESDTFDVIVAIVIGLIFAAFWPLVGVLLLIFKLAGPMIKKGVDR